MFLCDPQPYVMGLLTNRYNLTHCTNTRERLANFCDRHDELTRGERRKLVEYLDTDDTAGAQLFFCAIGFGLVGGEQIEKNVCIDKSLSSARWLPSGQT